MTGCTGPTAAMIINNPKDTLSPQSVSEHMRDIRLQENACQSGTQVTEQVSLSCVRSNGCSKNPVVFCPHTIDRERDGTYYPHVWPPGTADAMVQFFDRL